jgi:predicted AAA+ superfamily ATPase
LAAEADDSRFKVLFLDVGLSLASHGVGLLDLNRSAELTVVNAGAVAEQFVGQHLLHSDRPYKAPDLFFWARESRNSSAEVDYMLAEGGEVIPVEVKAGKTGTLKSMHAFLDEKSRSFAVRFNSLPPSLLDVETSLPSRPRRPFRLLSLPLYMVGQTRRLCGEVAGE